MSEPNTQQIAAAQAEQFRIDGILTRVINGATQADRMAAARELQLMSPLNQQIVETGATLRLLRTDAGQWWACVQGQGEPLSQAIQGTADEIEEFLTSVARLLIAPHLTDAEFAAAQTEASGG